MEYRTLGRTGLLGSVMGLGCGGHSRLGLRQGRSEDSAVAVVRRALELGVNVLDTAEAYGTEPVVGRAIAEASSFLPRERIILSTKVSVGQGAARRTGPELQEAAHAGLRRLQTDYVDILHLHAVSADDYEYCRSELVPAMQALQEAGKVRFLGITEAFAPDPQHRMLARAVADDDCWDVVMAGFNLVNQSARERVFPHTLARRIGVLDMFAVRRALTTMDALTALMRDLAAGGLLPAAGIAAAVFTPQALRDALQTGGGKEDTAGEPADSLPDAAYRFCRDEPGVDTVLVGTGSTAHLEANAASLSRPPLPPATTALLRGWFAGVDSVSGN
ncbi:MAG: aldo/keto reductase [Cytophagales bacterium]|nr:aldo/keto reductase [Armatimonadota bacterium]